ncbi:MAG: FHA domain-containing protein [Sandaracinaceae bacterium]|nr:FHA domain-containing protein [Sandaracinaceae bacterium]
MTGPPDGERAGGATSSDEFVERLGDRLADRAPERPPAPVRPLDGAPTPPEPEALPPGQLALPPAETSDVHQLGAVAYEDDALDAPPLDVASQNTGDAFAEFEDEFEGETTRIDDSNLLAEESTSILEAAPAQPFLFVERGKDQGREFVLQQGENGVGRGIDNDVILADVAVSRRHLKVIREGDKLTLRDLGSGNGTQLNGARVSTAVLTEGDRIELGETTLVVRLPGADLGPDASRDEATDEHGLSSGLPTPYQFGTPSDPLAIPHGPGYQPELTPSAIPAPAAAVAPRGAVVLPKAVFVAVILGGALLLAMFGAAIAVLAIKSSEPAEAPLVVVGAPTHYDLGVRAYQASRWDEARRELRAALEDPQPPPGQDPAEVQRYLARTELALRDQAAIDRARQLQGSGDLAAASTEAGSVRNTESPLFPTAQRLQREIAEERSAEAVRAGHEALRRRSVDEAGQQLALAEGFHPASPAVAQLRAEIARVAAGGAPAPAPPPAAPAPAAPRACACAAAPVIAPPSAPAAQSRAPTALRQAAARGEPPRPAPEPRPAPAGRRGTSPRVPQPAPAASAAAGITRTVIQYYLAGEFERAASTAETASRTMTGADQRQLAQLGENIRAFGRLWPRISAASFGPSVRREMSQAMALDARIANNPRYRTQLRSSLVRLHLADARAQRDPVTQCRTVRAASDIDATDAEVRRMAASCETIARGMLTGAASAPAARQAGIYSQILTMVPPSSPVAAEARRLLDARRRSSAVDEDE